MDKPVFDFGNRLNWDELIRGTFTATPAPNNKRGYIPIPEIARSTSAHIFMVGVRATNPAPNWWLGCRVKQSLLILPSTVSDFMAVCDANQKNCGLNTLTLVEFPRLTPVPYLLIIEVPYWIEQVYLEVWYYSGRDTTEEAQALERIETKIDALQPAGE